MNEFNGSFYFHAVLNPQGFISNINGKAFQDAEIEAELLIGQQFSDLIFWQHNDFTAELIANSLKLVSQGKPIEIDTTFRVNASTISDIKANFAPVFDSQNKVEQIVFFAVNITEYKKESEFYKKRSERFLFAAESAEVALWFRDLKTDEIFTTPRCNDLYGFAPDEIMNIEKFIEVIHPDDIAEVKQSINESHTNLTDYNAEFRVVLNDGKINWISVRGKTFKEDELSLVMMGSVRDITHRKLYDEKVKQLYAAERAARDEVEDANRAKDQFLALVSHELRSPLNSILGWTKILLGKKADEATQQNALEIIEKSAKFQAKLISDLVDSAKIISGKMNLTFRPVSLMKLVNGVYQSQKPLAEEKNINFILGKVQPVSVIGDVSRLQQVITNLITNSIKFTPSGGEIFIELTDQNNFAVFRITDSGSGIPTEELPSIFKQYYQSKSANNKTGLGLGLSIVKAIVDKHKGYVSAMNNENGIGCTFFVQIPLHITPNLEAPKEQKNLEKSTNSLKNVRILIVEDNDDSRDVLHYYLSDLGAQVHSVVSAQEGFDYLTSTQTLPDVIISDISMPEEDGYSFIGKVRNLPAEKGSKIPAIALTAFASNSDRIKTLSAGFQIHHAKPFEPDLLIRDILEVIESK